MLDCSLREADIALTKPASFAVALAFILVTPSAWAGPLHDAAREGKEDTLARLIAEGADVEAVDDSALTPLVTASLAGQKRAVEVLIDNGADPRGQDGKGFTALHAAAYAGHLEIVVLLMAHGVDIDDQQNKARITPLHAAVEGDFRAIAEVLLAQNVVVDVEDGSGWTPVMRATFKSYPEMVKLLRDHGAPCSKNAGKTFLDYCMNAGP
ncbi:MAG: ankyrin repeat domain-containing protein [Nitrospira sp.]|nr:ankyrin repeat domain-containing protein [Nitrospira sp.]